jgi:integrase/recombinase XerD
MSTLSKLLDDYLTTRRALGFKLTCEGTGLKTFVSFMERKQAKYITTKLALAWAQEPRSVQPAQWSRRLAFVRGFARYCSAFDVRTQVPPSDLLPFKYIRPEPYFFADRDIERLLQSSLKLRPESGLRRWTFHCLYGLLSVSGLRSCEARNLVVDDVNLVDGVLTIRSSKFGKSRLVVLHASVASVLASYLDRRRRFFGSRSHLLSHVFVNDCGSPLSSEQMLDTFQRLMKRIGVTANEAGRKPHLHDLRHHFALQTLLRWYRDGEEIERRLPMLSAYLGHVEVRDTYWYLSARPELLQLAKERLERYWEQTS